LPGEPHNLLYPTNSIGQTARVRVLFFAQLKDATQCDAVEIPILSPMNAEQLWVELLKKFPALAGHRSSVRLGKNCEYAGPEAQFSNSDEIALIPPVSGG
jgi:molybdopterin converting factor subunit 1